MGRKKSNKRKPSFFLGGSNEGDGEIIMHYNYGFPTVLDLFYGTGEKLPAENWNEERQIVKGHPEKKELMAYFNRLSKTAIEIVDEFGLIPREELCNHLDRRMGFLKEEPSNESVKG